MKIYIAGKITGDKNYKRKFKEAEILLREAGHVAISPAVLPDGMTSADYMRICFAMIDTADAVWFLPDWKQSKGAQLEHVYCEYIGKAIYGFNGVQRNKSINVKPSEVMRTTKAVSQATLKALEAIGRKAHGEE